MKKIFTSVSLITIISTILIIILSIDDKGVTSAYSFTSGSPGAKTNSPGDVAACTQCHGGALNPNNATTLINSLGLTNGYTPGQTYTISAAISGTSSSKIGFEVTAERDLNNAKAGSFVITDASRTKSLLSNTSVTHNGIAGCTAVSGSNAWTFDWVAPTAGTGDVTFYGVFNATNSNFATSGDEVYTATFTVNENTGVSIAEETNNSSLLLYPNPVKTKLFVSNSSNINRIELYNIRGEKIPVILTNNSIDLTHVENGVYFVNIDSNSGISSEKIIVLK